MWRKARRSDQPEPLGRLRGRWGRNLVAAGVLGATGIAAATTLVHGSPTLPSVLAAGGAAAGLLSLAAVPAPLAARPRPVQVRNPLATPIPATIPQGNGVPLVGVRTTTWPVGRSLRLRADHADETYLTAPATPTGDSIWESWEPVIGELPSRLVGPVPETFVPLEPTLASREFDIGVPTFVLPALTPVVPPVTSSLAPKPLDREDMAFTDIELEALTPIPPHLRPIDPVPLPVADALPPAPTEVPSAARARCASCRRVVAETPTWRRCPECHAALCAPCSIAALKTQARAWCTLCAPLYVAE